MTKHASVSQHDGGIKAAECFAYLLLVYVLHVQVPHYVVGREDGLAVLHQALHANVVRMGAQWYVQTRGVPQVGWVGFGEVCFDVHKSCCWLTSNVFSQCCWLYKVLNECRLALMAHNFGICIKPFAGCQFIQ